MKAGIDFGTSLVKAVWMSENDYRFSSTADTSLEEITKRLKNDGVKIVQIAGIGYSNNKIDIFRDFEIKTIKGDPIENELKLQAEGTKQMLKDIFNKKGKFLIVSIGTGTSYTIVEDDIVTKFPIGNSLGGGFIYGLSKIFGTTEYDEFSRKSLEGTPLDLHIKDILSDKRGTFEGDMVVANFGKGILNAEQSSIYASIISTVGIAIIRDIMLLCMIPKFQPPNDIVFIGSTVTRTPFLINILQKYSAFIGKNFYFPDYGEFALAMGAYLI